MLMVLAVTSIGYVACAQKIKAELEKILEPTYRNTLLANYDLLEKQLGGAGASDKTAHLIVQDMLMRTK